MAAPPTPLIRFWRTSFLTLRDESLTTPLPTSSSISHIFHNHIFSQSYSLLSAAPQLPSHEIHDICRRVTFNLNSSSFTNVLDCFRKMLDLFLGKVTTSDELTGSRSTATMIPAVECLQAIRCVINSCHRRWLQSEDALLVKFLLDVIVSSHAVSCGMPRSICKEKSIEINTGLSTESSSSELQTIAFEMLGETISRAGSSFPVDIWRSIIEVVRKTMDVLALKSPVAEDNIMCRFYESFLGCLHLILIDPKCSVSDHVSVFVSVLRTFLTYGVSSRSSSTSLLIGHEEKGLNIKSPQARLEQVTRSDRVAYRPPHLRKKESSNVKHNIVWHSQNILDHESSTVNATSSDSDFSDGDGSTKESGRGQNSRIRVAAIICIQARMASASTLVAMLDGPSSIFLQVAEYKESNKFGSFTALSSSLGQILLELHRASNCISDVGILYLIQHEAHGKLLALLFKILRLVISSTPYSRMPPNLLPNVVTSLRTRIEDGFRLRNDHSTLLVTVMEIEKQFQFSDFMFAIVGFCAVTEKKTGALFMLFEYSMQWSCPTICLEALQALKAVCHNYPNIVNACWEQVSATVHGFLSIVFREVPSGQAGEHVGSPTAFMSEKVLTSAIKVLDECLRAVSGFQGTEDLSDDKLVEIPFASDCIRVKKVSSAPSYDLEGKDDDLISFEACNSGNQQWCEVIEKHMPLILCHSSAMVRAASVTCFAGMTSAVFISFTKEKQNFILSSLIHPSITKNLNNLCSAEVLDRFIHAVEINSRDALISVRITASWALANICDAICHYVSILPLGHMGSSPNPKLLASLTDCALHLTKDGDKVKSNAVRALGYIARIFECSKSRFEDISVNCQGGGTEVHPSAENLMLKLMDIGSLWQRLKAVMISSFYAFAVMNIVDMMVQAVRAPVVFGILLQLLRDSSNFKIRIQAAAALAVPASVHDYGASFSGIVRCVEDILENIGQDQISGPSNFKYMVSLQKQLTLTMLHVLRFTSSTNDDQLKDFLVKKALVLEDWLKGLCSSIEGKLDVPVVDQKKVMLSSAIQSLIEVYKGKHQDVIAQKFEELKNTI
ncbi:hypothetical protein TanjilG_20963 [Lupinus angustifolius]|uniref:DUF4042 domain-containing protein n=1 Tax=Lupinus angustifolius TaxID=3871 RepID=A0A1J7HRE1_LUPAN|nr:hypothetical protein TanjilG_20963 [Lupinus angustifolius]